MTVSIRRSFACLALASLATMSACARGDDTPEGAEAAIARDSALARDLADARDSAAYQDAADVAMQAEPEMLPDPSMRTVDSVPRVTMRTGNSTVGGTRPAAAPRAEPAQPATRAAATPIPMPAPVPASPAPATTPPDAPRAPAATAAEACQSPTAGNQRRCLFAYLARSDAGLDRTYQSLIRRLKRNAGTAAGAPEPASVERLRVAQRAWLVYRDTECRRRNRGREGALWAPVRAQCLGEFSATREQELASQLASEGGR